MSTRIGTFQARRWLPNLPAGLVSGLLIANPEVSFATLIFFGPLAAHLADGIGFTLFGALVIGAVAALTSSYPVIIAMPISTPVPILALMAANIAHRMATTASGDAVFATAAMAIALTSILTGTVFLGLGKFKLGALVHYMPYPVIGGEKAALVQVLDLMRALASTRISEDPTRDEVYRLAAISQVNAEADHLNNDQY